MSIQAILYRKGSNVVTVAPGESVLTAARILRERNIAALVVAADGIIEGLVTEREIVHALARHGEDAARLSVREVMARDVITVAAHDSLKRAMSLMTRHRTRHLLVIGDVIKHRLEDLELTNNLKRDVYATAH
jgi:CBS domain-containing protein